MARVKGLPELLGRIHRMSERTKREAKINIADAITGITYDAQKRAPVDTGVLKQGIIGEVTQGGFNGTVTSNAEYSPYVEFGTGTKVQVPQELQAYAAQFKGKGERNVNLPARPFMVPAFDAGRKQLIKDLVATINRNVNRR